VRQDDALVVVFIGSGGDSRTSTNFNLPDQDSRTSLHAALAFLYFVCISQLNFCFYSLVIRFWVKLIKPFKC